MRLRRNNKRLDKVEWRLRPSDDRSYVLEELCRSEWRANPKRYRKMALENFCMRAFIPQFEREDQAAARGET
jgi:hypothetical protein